METFYPNKKVSSKTHMTAGAMDGVYQELTLRGKVVVEGRYSSDHKNGWWREWNDLGPDGLQLALEQHWKWGKLDGAVKKYEGGKLASRADLQERQGRRRVHRVPQRQAVVHRHVRERSTHRHVDHLRSGRRGHAHRHI